MVDQILIDRFNLGKLSQASLLVGDRDIVLLAVEKFLDVVFPGGSKSISTDLYWSRNRLLGVEEAREIRSRATRRASDGVGKFFVLAPENITTEAQNALLKTLEEPNPTTYFLIIIPEEKNLLPTLLSRLDRVSSGAKRLISVDPVRFLTASPQSRIREVTRLRDDAERLGSRVVIGAWLAELEIFFVSKLKNYPGEKDWQWAIVEIGRVRHSFGRPGSSDRLLLEHLALVLPPV